MRLAHALANSSEPAEVAARVADALADLGDVSFAEAYLVGAHGKLRLESRHGAEAPSASHPQLAAKAFASGALERLDDEPAAGGGRAVGGTPRSGWRGAR